MEVIAPVVLRGDTRDGAHLGRRLNVESTFYDLLKKSDDQ